MAELEDILEQINKRETIPTDLSEAELREWLGKKGREIGTEQSRLSFYSAEYKNLGEYRELIERAEQLLRNKEKDQSGLGQIGQQRPDERMPKPVSAKTEAARKKERISRLLERYIESEDKEEQQQIYREAAKEAWKGDAAYIKLLGDIACYEATEKREVSRLYEIAAAKGDIGAIETLADAYAKGVIVPKSSRKVAMYKDMAADAGNTELLYARAVKFLDDDLESAYRDFKTYVKIVSPLDMSCDAHRHALTMCYELGYMLKIDMDREELPEHWNRLLEHKGSYSDVALKLKGDERISKGDYVNGVQEYLNAGTRDAVKALEDVYFEPFFEENIALRKKLDAVLAQKREDDTTATDVRVCLYAWYAIRHTEGKDAVKDKALAYVYYAKIREITKDETLFQTSRQKLFEGMDINGELAFFKEIYEKGYSGATLYIGNLYFEKKQFDIAQEYYRMGVEQSTEQRIIDACKKNYEVCQGKIRQRTLYVEECNVWYVKCSSTAAAGKKEAFMKMRELADAGNTYACLRVAEIAEKRDAFLVEQIKNYPKEEQIFKYYEKAAQAGERDAMIRMVDIFAQGQLGQRRNAAESTTWRRLL